MFKIFRRKERSQKKKKHQKELLLQRVRAVVMTFPRDMQTADETENVQKILPPTGLMSRNERMAKGERWTKVAGHATSVAFDVLRNFEQNDDLRPCLGEKRDEPQDLLSRSFDKTNRYSSSSHDRYFSDIIPDSKQLVTKQFSSFASNSPSNSSLIYSHNGQRIPHSCSDELFLHCNEPRQMTRAGNSSDDSGITADVSYTPCQASSVSLQSSSSDGHQFLHDDMLFSSSKSKSSNETLKMLDLESLLRAAQMTPGSQRRAYPCTNPNFVTGQKPPVQNTSLLVSQAPYVVTDFDASHSFVMDPECHWQNSSSSGKHFADSEVFGKEMHNMDKGYGSDLHPIPKSICRSRQHEDSTPRGTSFLFRKLATDQSSQFSFPSHSFATDPECHWQNLSYSSKHFADNEVEVRRKVMHNMEEGDGSDKKILHPVSQSICRSRQHEDSTARGTSFIFRKLAADQASQFLFQDEAFLHLDVSSGNYYEDSRAALCSGFEQNPSESARHASEKSVLGRKNADMQFIVAEDRLETCRRTRHCSEPDYANMREIAPEDEAVVEELDGKRHSSARKEFSDARDIQVKEEPTYASDRLTGRGCLTYEDGYHLPTFTGNHGDSLSSSGRSNVSTPSPQVVRWARETRHISHRQKKLTAKSTSGASKSFVDRSHSLHSELLYQRPVSMTTPLLPEMDSVVHQVAEKLTQRADMEQFLLDNLNVPRKGFLGKKVPVGSMLFWTKASIQKPMIQTENKVVKKEAPYVFKLIQTFMGDRKSRETGSRVALELVSKGWSIPELRDEIYVQLCRQTRKNSRSESLLNGWELMGICLSFFPPSAKFQSYLEDHFCQAQESHDHTEGAKLHAYALVCKRRLDKACQIGRVTRKPNPEDLERQRKSLLQPSMFGSTLEDVMDLQRDRYPTYQLPWIQVTLSEALMSLTENQMPEGIFRVPGDADEVNSLREKLDQWIQPSPHTDPHVLASILKLWYRELYEPLIPDEFYDDCIENFDNPSGAVDIVDALPLLHRVVLTYLIKFLQRLASSEYSSVTKMDASNLAMVMAPNCLHCLADIPQLLFENARKEMGFLRTLIQNLEVGPVDCAQEKDRSRE